MVDFKRSSGVVVGLVTDVEDPENLGRVKVRFPWLADEPQSTWCRVAMPLAGPDHGLFYTPEVDSEALVAFEHGDFSFPYIVGYLWNGDALPPESDYQQRTLKSVSGNQLVLDDREGDEGITLTDKHGNTIIMNKDGIEIKAKKITLTSETELKAVGDPINLNP